MSTGPRGWSGAEKNRAFYWFIVLNALSIVPLGAGFGVWTPVLFLLPMISMVLVPVAYLALHRRRESLDGREVLHFDRVLGNDFAVVLEGGKARRVFPSEVAEVRWASPPGLEVGPAGFEVRVPPPPGGWPSGWPLLLAVLVHVVLTTGAVLGAHELAGWLGWDGVADRLMVAGAISFLAAVMALMQAVFSLVLGATPPHGLSGGTGVSLNGRVLTVGATRLVLDGSTACERWASVLEIRAAGEKVRLRGRGAELRYIEEAVLRVAAVPAGSEEAVPEALRALRSPEGA